MIEIERSSVDAIKKRLAQDRPLFHSEADFQLALGWCMHETLPKECSIRLDICLLLGGDLRIKIALELKYPTAKFMVCEKGEDFRLSQQGARDQKRYDFWKDVERLETVVKKAVPASRSC